MKRTVTAAKPKEQPFTVERRSIWPEKTPRISDDIQFIIYATGFVALELKAFNALPDQAAIIWGSAGVATGIIAAKKLWQGGGKPRASTPRATSSQFASVQQAARIEARPGWLARWGFGRQGWKTEDERNDHIIYTKRIAPRVQFTFDTIPGFCVLDTPIVEGDLLRFFEAARKRQNTYSNQGIRADGVNVGSLMTVNDVLSFAEIRKDIRPRLSPATLRSCYNVAQACRLIKGRKQGAGGELVNGGAGIGGHLWSAGRMVEHCKDIWGSVT